jgi:hypothetical protein
MDEHDQPPEKWRAAGDLRAQGWTDDLVDQVLGEADAYIGHMAMYRPSRVREAERRPAVRRALKKEEATRERARSGLQDARAAEHGAGARRRDACQVLEEADWVSMWAKMGDASAAREPMNSSPSAANAS